MSMLGDFLDVARRGNPWAPKVFAVNKKGEAMLRPVPQHGGIELELYQSQVWRILIDGHATRDELSQIDAPKLVQWLHERGISELVAAYRILRLLGRIEP
jgi:hypothetical protein